MTLNITSKINAFIMRMQENEEQARWGFELILKRDDYDEFFDVLNEAGLFSPAHNPSPVPAGQPGYVHIPYWFTLKYLLEVAKLAGINQDTELAEKVLTVVRQVSHAREDDGSIKENYHTWREFADIFGLVPTAVINIDDIDLIPAWLSSKYDRGGVCHSLDLGCLKNLLDSDAGEDWDKAVRLLQHCTAIEWEDEKGFEEKRKKPVTIVDDYWLQELIDHHSEKYGIKNGGGSARIFLDRIREVYAYEGRDVPSWLRRPAIEVHTQNHSWAGPENRFVEGLRDVLLSWSNHDISTAKPFIADLFNDDAEIVRRIAIFILNQHWELLNDVYLQVLSPQLFDSDHLHEMYGLLQNHFHGLSIEHKTATIDAIRQIPVPEMGEEPQVRQRYRQRNWLSAITGSGYDPVDTWFQELDADEAIGPLQEHPDFHSYSVSWSGPGPSPYSISELITYVNDGNIIEQLNDFEQKDSWRGPTTRALVDTLVEAVVSNHKDFIGALPGFINAKRPYQYGMISGYKRLWELPEEKQLGINWEQYWQSLMSFFETLLQDTGFWTEQVEVDRDLTPNRDWLLSIIAELLRSGVRNDVKAYPEELLQGAWTLLEVLLENVEQETESDEDAVHQAINSTKGKVIEALFSHALRECRISDRENGNHTEAWVRMRPVFDRELAKCKNANYEFSTLLGNYIVHIDYMSHEWLEGNLANIFPQEHVSNYTCALEGLSYAPATRDIYVMLRDNGIVDFAIHNELKGKHLYEKIIERIALAYLWDEEELDSPRFTRIFDTEKSDDLVDISSYFWSVRNQQLTEEQIDRIFRYWESCIEWNSNLETTNSALLSSLGMLSCYMEEVGERESRLLHTVAPHMGTNYNSDRFVDQLDRLIGTNPTEISAVFGELINSVKIISDYRGRLKSLIEKLDEHGLHENALEHANSLRHLPGMIELFEQIKANV